MPKRIGRTNVVVVGAAQQVPGRKVYRGKEREGLFPEPSRETLDAMERLERMSVSDTHRLRGFWLD